MLNRKAEGREHHMRTRSMLVFLHIVALAPFLLGQDASLGIPDLLVKMNDPNQIVECQWTEYIFLNGDHSPVDASTADKDLNKASTRKEFHSWGYREKVRVELKVYDQSSIKSNTGPNPPSSKNLYVFDGDKFRRLSLPAKTLYLLGLDQKRYMGTPLLPQLDLMHLLAGYNEENAKKYLSFFGVHEDVIENGVFQKVYQDTLRKVVQPGPGSSLTLIVSESADWKRSLQFQMDSKTKFPISCESIFKRTTGETSVEWEKTANDFKPIESDPALLAPTTLRTVIYMEPHKAAWVKTVKVKLMKLTPYTDDQSALFELDTSSAQDVLDASVMKKEKAPDPAK